MGVLFEAFVEVSLILVMANIIWWGSVSCLVGFCLGGWDLLGVWEYELGGIIYCCYFTPCVVSLALLVWGCQLGVISMFAPFVGDKVQFPRCEYRPL